MKLIMEQISIDTNKNCRCHKHVELNHKYELMGHWTLARKFHCRSNTKHHNFESTDNSDEATALWKFSTTWSISMPVTCPPNSLHREIRIAIFACRSLKPPKPHLFSDGFKWSLCRLDFVLDEGSPTSIGRSFTALALCEVLGMYFDPMLPRHKYERGYGVSCASGTDYCIHLSTSLAVSKQRDCGSSIESHNWRNSSLCWFWSPMLHD